MKKKISLVRILEITISAIIVFAVSWGVFTATLNAQGKRIQTLETKYDNILEMKGDILVIKSQISDLKEDVSDIKRALSIK